MQDMDNTQNQWNEIEQMDILQLIQITRMLLAKCQRTQNNTK